jgi:putative FmdB family regulatory protein
MPLYEYQCESCGHRFEVIHKFSDATVRTCPNCAGTVRRLLSSPAIQFKGSGFYITDYARKSSAGSASGKGSEKPSESKGESVSASSSGSSEGGTSTPPSASSESKKD